MDMPDLGGVSSCLFLQIIVARGKEDVTIKIMDEGGGIRRSDLQHMWSYMYSTAPKPMASQLSGVPLDDMSSEMFLPSPSSSERREGGGHKSH